MANLSIKKPNFFAKHKIAIFFIVLVLAGGGYYGYTKIFNTTKSSVRYVTEAAQKTTLTVSVTGSGQVSDLNRIDLKPAAGTSNVTIAQTNVKNGDKVKEGQIIATIDQKNSESSLHQAQASLASAQASYNKLLAGAAKIDIEISQNSVKQAEVNYNNAVASLENTKKTTAQSIAQAERNVDNTKISGSENIESKKDAEINTIQDKLNSAKTTLDSEEKIYDDRNAEPYLGILNSSLTTAKGEYSQAVLLISTANTSLANVKLSRADTDFSQASNDTSNVLNKISSSLTNLYDALQGSLTGNQFTQTTLDSYKSTASSLLSSTNSAAYSVQTAEQALVDAIRTADENNISAQASLDSANLSASQQITSAQNQIVSSKNSWQSAKDSLAKLTAPAEASSIASSRAQVINATVQLEQAQNNYNNNIVTAPFDGVIAVMNVQKGAQVSASTIIATEITTQKIALVSFNEVDASKIKVGDKVILTFDAIDSLSLTGKIVEIDALGTVASNVVTYGTKITFDTQDDRVKSNMSVNVEVITDVKTDIIVVSNAAVKTDNGTYVQTLDANGQPQNVNVKIGIANDTYTEITQGLNEGDKVVTQTVTTGATTGTQSQQSSGGLRIPGIGGGGGGGFRGN